MKMVPNRILISVGLLVMFQVYLSWSFCDRCPTRPTPGTGQDEYNDNLGDIEAAQNRYTADHQAHPQSEDETHERHIRDAPRANRRRGRRKDRRKKGRRDPVETTLAPTSESPEGNMSDVCNICWMRARRRKYRIESIRDAVLDKLEMKQAPNISWPSVREDLPPGIFGPNVLNNSNTDDQSMAESEPLDDSTQIVQFTNAPPPEVRLREQYENTSIVYFKLEADVHNSQLHQAILYLYLVPNPIAEEEEVFLTIYTIKRTSRGRVEVPPQPSRRVSMTLNQETGGTWETIDVKSIVQRWVTPPRLENLGLYIVARRRDGQNFAVLNSDDEAYKDKKPCLKTKLTEHKSTRSKRRLGEDMNCDERSAEPRCCRYPLLVDFDEFGWEWIVQPRQYRAYYCAGNCPYSFNRATPHSHVVGSILDYELGGPCCTPTKMSAISMIYYDETVRMKKRTLKDMVVDSCGCK